MTTEEIQKLATLARLSITDEEASALSSDMNKILGYIKQIESAHIDSAEKPKPTLFNIVREDTVSSSDEKTKQLIKENFPKQKNGFLEVNKIINND